MSAVHLKQALDVLSCGGLIACPTEAVYGLSCVPEEVSACYRILKLKRRPLSKGLLLVAARSEQLEPYIDYPDADTKHKILSSWPGPFTWVLSAKASVPFWVTGGRRTVAVRVSAHPTLSKLCEQAGVLISTSANLSSCKPATHPIKVRCYFGPSIDFILPGPVGTSKMPTEIREAKTGQILRRGEPETT